MLERTMLEQGKVFYIKVQAGKNMPAYPAGSDALADVGCTSEFAQARKVDSLIRHNGSYSKYPGFTAGFNGSKATIKCPIKIATVHTGTLNADIHGGVLLEEALGIVATAPPADAYAFSLRATTTTEKYYTIAIDYDTYIVWLFNCKIANATLPFKAEATAEDVTTLTCEFECLSFAVAGSSQLTADAIATALTVNVGDPYQFAGVAQFKIVGEAGTPAHTITNVNYTTGDITFTTQIAAGGVTKESVIYGYIATGAAPANNTIYSGHGYVVKYMNASDGAVAPAATTWNCHTALEAGKWAIGNEFRAVGDPLVYVITGVVLNTKVITFVNPATGLGAVTGWNNDAKVYRIMSTMGGTAKIAQPLSVEPREKKNSDWPTYLKRSGPREITLDFTNWCTEQDRETLLFPWTEKSLEIIIEFGDVTAIPWLTLTLPYAQVTAAKVEDGAYEGIKIPTTVTAFGLGSNDELTGFAQLS